MLKEKDKRILDYLKDGPKTTYQLSKVTEMSWATVDAHCKDLMIEGKLDREVIFKDEMKVTIWRLK